MSEFCPHCEGEMDAFGGVHLRSCPLAQGDGPAAPSVSEHREKAVEAVDGEFYNLSDSAISDILKAAEPHLQRMYWERFREAVLTGDPLDAIAHGLYSRFARRPGNGVESIDGYWRDVPPQKKLHWRRVACELLGFDLDKAQDLMGESK